MFGFFVMEALRAAVVESAKERLEVTHYRAAHLASIAKEKVTDLFLDGVEKTHLFKNIMYIRNVGIGATTGWSKVFFDGAEKLLLDELRRQNYISTVLFENSLLHFDLDEYFSQSEVNWRDAGENLKEKFEYLGMYILESNPERFDLEIFKIWFNEKMAILREAHANGPVSTDEEIIEAINEEYAQEEVDNTRLLDKLEKMGVFQHPRKVVLVSSHLYKLNDSRIGEISSKLSGWEKLVKEESKYSDLSEIPDVERSDWKPHTGIDEPQTE